MIKNQLQRAYYKNEIIGDKRLEGVLKYNII